METSGVDAPEHANAPFVLASTTAMMNIEATVYFAIEGVTLVKKGEAEKIKMGSFPSLKEVMNQALRAGVRLIVCEQSCGPLKIRRRDFTKNAEIVGAANLDDLAPNADSVLCF